MKLQSVGQEHKRESAREGDRFEEWLPDIHGQSDGSTLIYSCFRIDLAFRYSYIFILHNVYTPRVALVHAHSPPQFFCSSPLFTIHLFIHFFFVCTCVQYILFTLLLWSWFIYSIKYFCYKPRLKTIQLW